VFNNGTQKNIINVNGSKVSGEIPDATIVDYFMENAYSDILNVKPAIVSFESTFSAERQKEIISNFATKHNMNEAQALDYINNAIATKGQEAIDKLKECY
jgi:hypothetical protein